MTTYQQTHPWLTFQVDLARLAYTTWIRLGEAQSKCEHLSSVPLQPAYAQELHQVYLAKGVLATTAIEGNTLTEQQVRQRIRGELSLPPSKAYLGQEVDNILAACDAILREMVTGDGPVNLSVDRVKAFNKLVLRDLPLDADVVPGEIRAYPVGVGSYKAPEPADCRELLEKYCAWLNAFGVPGEDAILYGILKAIIAHVYLVWIHPFGDGNGRTARLIEFQILLAHGVPSVAAQLLSNHYNETRTEYYRQLDPASKNGGDLEPFIQYAVRGFVDELRAQIDMVDRQQLQVHWHDYIYDVFRDLDSTTDRRRRNLILDLTGQPDPVPLAKVRHVSPRMAEAYAGRSDKTVQRDVDTLEGMKLVQRNERGEVAANIELMLAFQPARRVSPAAQTKR